MKKIVDVIEHFISALFSGVFLLALLIVNVIFFALTFFIRGKDE